MRTTYVYDARKWAERQTLQSFGYELEQVYAEILGGKVNPSERDCGRDFEFPDPTDPRKTVGVQVKTIFYREEVVRFLARALRGARFQGRSWTNFCIGEPPRVARISMRTLILESLEQYGAWVEEGLPLRQQILQMFQRAREEFPPHTVQRVLVVPSMRGGLALAKPA